MPNPKGEYAVLAILILIGTVLRFWNIGFQNMTMDEEFTIGFSGLGITTGQVFIQALTTDFTPPLYYLAAHISMVIFGATAEAIRYPSAIAGIMLIPIMYYIGKEYKDEPFGLMFAGFTTVFYSFIYYSKYGRAYSMAVLFFSITFYYFMRLMKGDKHSSIPFGIFALLSLWTHLYAVIPLGVMILYLLWEQKVYLYGILITIIGSLPLLNYLFLINTTRDISQYTFGETPLAVLLWTPIDIFAYSSFVIFPIIVWSLWKYRADKLLRIISVFSLATWISMMVLAMRTPIVPHYAILLVPALLLALLTPLYLSIKAREIYFHYYLVIMVVLLLEFVQIWALNFIQRIS
jgi:4-amino-4-deoxy-L-arabinose transferase-like glycosyltransferase